MDGHELERKNKKNKEEEQCFNFKGSHENQTNLQQIATYYPCFDYRGIQYAKN
jgi:hypothetical protein